MASSGSVQQTLVIDGERSTSSLNEPTSLTSSANSGKVMSFARVGMLLLGGNLLLLSIVVLETLYGFPIDEGQASKTAAKPLTLEQSMLSPASPYGQYKALADAHLFSPDLSQVAPVQAKQSAPAADPPPPQLLLLAAVLTPTLRMAVLSTKGPGEPTRILEGDVISGWRLSKIYPDHVVLQQGSRTFELYLADSATDPQSQKTNKTKAP